MGANGSACDSSTRPSRAISSVATKELARAVGHGGHGPVLLRKASSCTHVPTCHQQRFQALARFLDDQTTRRGTTCTRLIVRLRWSA